jgi:RNA polymerase sigma factor (sigma-70 family)
MMSDDLALLREYARRNSETAFAALVSRHINLVHSVALRQVRDPHLARDITQAVFVILARKADSIGPQIILSGWLCRTARYVSANALTIQRRRQCREQEAHMQSILNEPEPEDWRQIAPLLDAAMERLGQKDHDAIVLRFFEGRNFREVGVALGASEDAAKMRVSRAVEKLRKFFTKRGVVLTAAVIAGAISTNSVRAAPATLAKSATAAAIAKGAAAGGSTLTLIKGTLKLMAWTKAKAAVTTAVVVGLAAYSAMQHQAQLKLRGEDEALRRQMARVQADNERLSKKPRAQTPQLPAPQIQVAATPAPLPTNDAEPASIYERFKDIQPRLTPEQLEAYLKANGRNAASLLAAFRTSGDPALLREAMGKYPNDPQVDFEAAIDKDLSPAEQRQWLNAFEKSVPDNALANYLSAYNYFNSGQTDQGVQELAAAAGKPFDDYTVSRVQDDVEAYLAAGYSLADATVLGTRQLMLPQLAQLKQLGLDTVELANAYSQTGDQTSAQAALQMAASLGQNYASPSPGESTVSQLVGIRMEETALQAMNPSSPYGNTGQTVQDQINALEQQNTSVRELGQQASAFLPALSDEDWIIYKDRWLMLGEENAQRWVINKYGQQ